MDKINSIQKVGMKKSKRIFAFLFALVMLMQTTFVSFGSFAEEAPKKFKAYTNARTPEFIEIGEIDGGQVKNPMVAYCLNYKFAYPKVKELKDKSAEYTKLDSKDLKDLETTKKDKDLYENLRRVLYNGYPTDGAHFVEFGKVSENRMRFLTQYAIWHYTDEKSAQDFKLSGSEKEIFESLINPNSENLRKVPDSFNPTLFKNDKSIKADNSANAHKPYFQNLIGSPKSDDKTYDIYAQKVWEGMTGSDKPVVEFELQEKNGDKKVDIANNPVEMTVSKDKEMSDVVVWKDLKKSPTEYKVVEKYKSDADSKKYISSSLTGNGRKESPYTITNGKLNSSFILQIKINKRWENVGGVEKPEVYLGLFRKTATKQEELVTKDMLKYGMGQKNHPNFENPIKVDSSQSIFTKDLTQLNLLGKVDGNDENSESYIYFMKELKKVGEKFEDFDAKGFTSKLETNNLKDTNPIFTFTNTYTGKFKINISKKKIVGEDELQGADLRVLKSTGENVISWTSSNKPKEIELTEGDYKLVEDTAPAGYEKVSVFEFSVNKKGEVTLKNNVEGVNVDNSKSTLIVRDKDEKVSKNIKISKISNDQTPLKDVEIKITKINDKTNLDTDISLNPDKDIVAKFITTGTDEEISLKPGSYKLEEISTPETHEKLEKVIYFDVDENGTITLKAGEDYNNIAVADKDKLTVINKKKPEELKEISISKQNLAGEEIEGARIQIKTLDGQVAKGKLGEESDKELIWTSGKNSQKISLKAGTYIFHEETAPKGYTTVTDIKFTVSNDGKISDLKFFENGKETKAPTENESKVEGETKLVVKDKIEEKAVINTSIGFDGNFAQAGQELNLTKDKAGTDKTVEDKINYANLPSGQKYTFKADLYEFPLDANEWKNVGSTQETVDVPEIGSGEIKVKFEKVTLNVGSKYTVVVKVESNNNLLEKESKLEKHIINHNEDKNDKAETIIVEKDIPQPEELKEISISKQNLAGEEIEGAKIQIKTLDGQVVKGKLGEESDKELSWTSRKTSQKISLKAGTYIFHEEAAPNGYKTVTDIKFTVDNDGKISDLKFFENGTEKKAPTENESKVEGETKLVVKDKIEEKAV
ncbi:SpaA isopeptide-forming pilin-related protein, partial [Parvimonas parva]